MLRSFVLRFVHSHPEAVGLFKKVMSKWTCFYCSLFPPFRLMFIAILNYPNLWSLEEIMSDKTLDIYTTRVSKESWHKLDFLRPILKNFYRQLNV